MSSESSNACLPFMRQQAASICLAHLLRPSWTRGAKMIKFTTCQLTLLISFFQIFILYKILHRENTILFSYIPISPSCTCLCYQKKILSQGSADPPQQSRSAWARMMRHLSDTSSLLAWPNSRNSTVNKTQLNTLFAKLLKALRQKSVSYLWIFYIKCFADKSVHFKSRTMQTYVFIHIKRCF